MNVGTNVSSSMVPNILFMQTYLTLTYNYDNITLIFSGFETRLSLHLFLSEIACTTIISRWVNDLSIFARAESNGVPSNLYYDHLTRQIIYKIVLDVGTSV